MKRNAAILMSIGMLCILSCATNRVPVVKKEFTIPPDLLHSNSLIPVAKLHLKKDYPGATQYLVLRENIEVDMINNRATGLRKDTGNEREPFINEVECMCDLILQPHFLGIKFPKDESFINKLCRVYIEDGAIRVARINKVVDTGQGRLPDY